MSVLVTPSAATNRPRVATTLARKLEALGVVLANVRRRAGPALLSRRQGEETHD